MEKVRVQGLLWISGGMFAVWGGVVALKGVYDRFLGGEPEANLYAPEPWAFVTREQWVRYASFEVVYGLACLALAVLLFKYSRFLPEMVLRPKSKEPTLLD